MLAHSIVIGGVEIGLSLAKNLDQTYEPVDGGRSLRRKLSGAGHLQIAWNKWRTVISGQGRVPPGLDGLDYSVSQSVFCCAPRAIRSAGTAVTLPAARRTDFPPKAFAVVTDRLIQTGYSLAGDAATLTAVAGASEYITAYYPVMTLYLTPPRTRFDARGMVQGWELIGEEV